MPAAVDTLSIYTEDVARHKVLSREAERAVGRRAMAGDEEAREELVRANLRFVISVAKKYQNQGVPLMDLIQAGNIGLHHAAGKYDPSQGNRFISYAFYWIRQAISGEIDKNRGAVAPSPTQMLRIRAVRRLLAEATQQGRELTPEEIAAATGYTLARVNEALAYRGDIRSLDAPLGEDDGTPMHAVLAQDTTSREEAEAEADLSRATAAVLDQVLSPREAEYVRLYFGIGRTRPLALCEVALMHGISRERARQIVERALRKLRKATEHHPFLLDHFTPAAVARGPDEVPTCPEPDDAAQVAPAPEPSPEPCTTMLPDTTHDTAAAPATDPDTMTTAEIVAALEARGWLRGRLALAVGYVAANGLGTVLANGREPQPHVLARLRQIYAEGLLPGDVTIPAAAPRRTRQAREKAAKGSVAPGTASVAPTAQPGPPARASEATTATVPAPADRSAIRAAARAAMFDLAGRVAAAGADRSAIIAVLAGVEDLVDRVADAA